MGNTNPKYQEQIYASQVAGVINSGRKVVAAHGTAEALAGNVPCRSVVITAETDNLNPVTVGGSDVVGALATRKGIPLAAGQSVTLGIDNLSKIYLDCITDGEGVTYAYLL